MKKEEEYHTHFAEQSHRILIGGEDCGESSDQAFCDPEPETDSDYCLNTATWD